MQKPDTNVEYLAAESWNEEMPGRMRWLQQNDPVHWSEKDSLYLLTKFEDVAYASKHQEIFTSALGVRPGMPNRLGLIDEAEPRHTHLRNLINRGFTPRMVRKLEVAFREITTEAIDAVAGQGVCDFVPDIAVPLPLLLIAEMIGIRKEDRSSFHEWSDAMVAGDGNFDNPEIIARAGQAFLAYSKYITEIIEERRREPRDDLVSILVGAKDQGALGSMGQGEVPDIARTGNEGSLMADDELIMMLVLLMVAGNETTRNALAGGMALLIENPEERQKLIDDPSLIPSACEEMVRVVSPVHSFARTCTRDVELRGVQMREGDKILLLYPAANRDPEAFEDPDSFRVERNPTHLGYGLGPHFCMGANLARMELRVAFSELLRRLPDMEYASGGPVVVPSSLVRSCVEMKVRYTPES